MIMNHVCGFVRKRCAGRQELPRGGGVLFIGGALMDVRIDLPTVLYASFVRRTSGLGASG